MKSVLITSSIPLIGEAISINGEHYVCLIK